MTRFDSPPGGANLRTMTTLQQFRRTASKDEGRFIRDALRDNAWSLTETADVLGVNPSTLRALIRRHDLVDEYKRRNPGPGRPRRD